jgi:hypothetical protein
MSTTAETGDRQRVFPPIDADVYRAAHTGQPEQGWALLRLADESLSFTARYLDRQLAPRQRVGRALSLHRDALAAELEGRFERADFYWRQLLREVARFDSPAWEAAGDAAMPSASGADRTDVVRRALVRELFLETHLAFYRGYVASAEALTLTARAFVHFRYVTQWLDRAELSEHDLMALLGSPANTIVTLSTETKSWSVGMDACELVLKHCPGATTFQDRLARLYWDRAMAGVAKDSDGSAALRDAKQMLAGIESTEALIERYPYCSVAYDYAAHLHHVRAIALANGGMISQAMFECEKALAYDAGFAEAQQTRAALVDAMKQLQERVKELLADVARRPNARLSSKGIELRDEANAGFGPAVDYQRSAERTRTLERAYRARARRVWHRVGLPEPPDDFDGQAELLYEMLGQIFSKAPTDRPAILREFAAIAAYPRLSPEDWEAVVAFVEQRIGIAEAPAAVDDSPQLPAGPALAPTTTAATRGGEPFAYWVFSGQDWRLKTQAAAAIALVLLGTGLIGRDTFAQRSRDAAYAQLEAAAQEQQHLKVIESAEQFLDHPPLSGSDPRQDDVVALYGQALVRWVAAQPGEIGPDGVAHAERYRRLASSRNQ